MENIVATIMKFSNPIIRKVKPAYNGISGNGVLRLLTQVVLYGKCFSVFPAYL
jgi:hypothetical protein